MLTTTKKKQCIFVERLVVKRIHVGISRRIRIRRIAAPSGIVLRKKVMENLTPQIFFHINLKREKLNVYRDAAYICGLRAMTFLKIILIFVISPRNKSKLRGAPRTSIYLRSIIFLDLKDEKRADATSRKRDSHTRRSDVAFGVPTSRINRRMSKLLDIYGTTRK